MSFHEDGNTSFRVTCCSSHPIERTRPTPVVVGETEMNISTLVTRGWNISNNRSGGVDVVVVVNDGSKKATATPGAWRREAGSLAGDFLPSRKVGLSLNSWTLPRVPDTPPCIGTWAMGDGIITAGAQI